MVEGIKLALEKNGKAGETTVKYTSLDDLPRRPVRGPWYAGERAEGRRR